MGIPALRVLAVLALAAALLTGCGPGGVVFTNEIPEDQLLWVMTGSSECVATTEEGGLYLRDTYRELTELLETETLPEALDEELIRQQALARLMRVKVLNLWAAEHGVEAGSGAADAAAGKAADYLVKYPEESASAEMLTTFFLEEAVAELAYTEMTKDADLVISDDEARAVKLEVIRIAGANAEGVPLSQPERNAARLRGVRILEAVHGGRGFAAAAGDEGLETELLELTRGSTDHALEEAAFDLEPGAVSPVVETPTDFYVLRCISNYEKSSTDLNREAMIRQRRQERFSQVYGDYLESVDFLFQEERWEALRLELSGGEQP